MAQRDNKSLTQVVFLGERTLSGATPDASDWVDTRGFDSCTVLVATGAVTDAGTAAGIVAEVQDNDDTTAAGAVAVVDDELIGAETELSILLDTDDNKVIGGVGYVGNARYVRVNWTGSTGTNAVVRAFAVLQHTHRGATTFAGTGVAAT